MKFLDLTDQILLIGLHDFTENQYNKGIQSLRDEGYVTNKDQGKRGLTITEEGQKRLTQLQRDVDREKKIDSEKQATKPDHPSRSNFLGELPQWAKINQADAGENATQFRI